MHCGAFSRGYQRRIQRNELTSAIMAVGPSRSPEGKPSNLRVMADRKLLVNRGKNRMRNEPNQPVFACIVFSRKALLPNPAGYLESGVARAFRIMIPGVHACHREREQLCGTNPTGRSWIPNRHSIERYGDLPRKKLPAVRTDTPSPMCCTFRRTGTDCICGVAAELRPVSAVPEVGLFRPGSDPPARAD
jgi:hypothetical protein